MKLLMVLSRFPYPLEKGDKLRAYNQLKELSKVHEISLFVLSDKKVTNENLEQVKPYCKQITIVRFGVFQIAYNLIRAYFRGLPLQVGYFYFKGAQAKFDKLVKQFEPEHIYCQLIRTSEYALRHKNISATLDYMDVFSKGIDRRIEREPAYLKPILRMECERLISYEKKVFDLFKNKIIISEQDRSYIPHPLREQIFVIPNGVDLSFFKPKKSIKEFDLIFNGNMNYPPNIESVEFLVNEVMPLVNKHKSGVKLLISGADPSPRVKRLAQKNIVVSGWVQDIRENFYKSKILVAPMQISIGLQNKLLEAMAMKLPCVSSVLANNALKAIPGDEILVAEQAHEYAKHIVDLLNDPVRAEQIAEKAYSFVLNKYDWKATVAQLSKVLEGK